MKHAHQGTILAALLLTLSLNCFAEGFRTNSSGRVYYCSTCSNSHSGSRINIVVPPGTSQKEIDRLVKKSLADFYKIQAAYTPKKGSN